jgi:hypothetical protein
MRIAAKGGLPFGQVAHDLVYVAFQVDVLFLQFNDALLLGENSVIELGYLAF